MKELSPQTRKLIQQLNEPRGFVEALSGSRDYVSLLLRIGNSKELAALIEILPFVLSKKRDIAGEAAAAVDKLIRETTARELQWLDEAMRRRSPYSGESFYEWHKLSPEQLLSFEHFGETSVSLLGMASFHQSGYVREAAIKRLALISRGTELPFLILRVNDWVSNVRDAANQAIQSRLKPDYAPSFIENLTLVSRLEEAGRADHKPLVQAIYQLLQSAECRTALLDALKSEDRFIRRASFKLALGLNSSEPDLSPVVRLALNEKDTVVRVWAAQRVSSAFEGATLDHFVELMKCDKFMPVRREPLRIEVQRNSPELLSDLRTALLDTHASMREEARYHLRKLDPMDVATFYRQHVLVAEGLTLYAVICGLGETGTAADDLLIMPYASHPAAKIRWAAMRALAKLNSKAHVDLFIEGLKDQFPYVSRQAFNALTEKAGVLSGERIWELFQSSAHAHVRRNALSLIEKLGKWDSIYYLLRAVRDADEVMACMSRFAIQRWLARFNRSFSSPTPEQLTRLGNALEEGGNLLDDRTVDQLRFSTRGFN